MFDNKKMRVTLRILLVIMLLILFKTTTLDNISNIEIYVLDFCIVFLSSIWTAVEILDYEGWKP